jgi:transcriptional regulator with XRE-family HTH domain
MKVDQKNLTPETTFERLAKLGEALRGFRLKCRLTHEQVAESCQFSRQTLSRIERGDPSVAIGQIARYAELVGANRALSLAMPAAVGEGQRRVRRTSKEKRMPRLVPAALAPQMTATI